MSKSSLLSFHSLRLVLLLSTDELTYFPQTRIYLPIRLLRLLARLHHEHAHPRSAILDSRLARRLRLRNTLRNRPRLLRSVPRNANRHSLLRRFQSDQEDEVQEAG